MIHKRLVTNLLHFNNLRKLLGNVSYSLAAKAKLKLEIIDSPPTGNVLVLSPHPDDDVFGCGGALALHQKNGDKIKIVYLTSNPERKVEATDASCALNFDDLVFLDLVEGKFSADKKTIEKLLDIISDFKPNTIYCPNFADPHPDHFETASILAVALKKLPAKIANSISILLYEIWTPIYANRLLKIDSVIEIKKAAISCHRSQMKERQYLNAILGLNAYRAGMFSAGHYAEAFTSLNSQLFLALFSAFSLNPKSLPNQD